MRFILIDRIERLEPGKRAEGHKLISPDEDYFRDHFPGYPIVPGVLILESLAQLGGRLVEASARAETGRRVLPVLGKLEHARLLRSVRPGDRLDLEVDLLAVSDDAARVAGVARVGPLKAATVEIMYALIDVGGDAGVLDAAQSSALRQWSDELWRELWREP